MAIDSNLPDGVRTSDLPGNRPEDAAEEQYQDWLEAKEGNGKRRISNLIELYCIDGIFEPGSRFQKFCAAWMLALSDFEASMPTGLADFDAYCRKIYEEGE